MPERLARTPQREAELNELVARDAEPIAYEWIDAAALARAIGVTRATVAAWINGGVLAGRRVGNPHSKLRTRLVDWKRAWLGAMAFGDPRTARALTPHRRE